MSRIRGRDTAPEKAVRSALHTHGFRFSLIRKDLPGKPDIVLPKYRAVVFVHGCFWHRHKGCKNATTPTANAKFWADKFTGNVERDAHKSGELRRLGWRVFVVWECETDHGQSMRRVLAALRRLRDS
jgi:DNA mismatch endonuclease, patch repair protein